MKLLLLVALFVTVISAVQVFEVRTTSKTAAHPWYNNGFPAGYTIDGVEGAELTLVRGQFYKFTVWTSSFHPFYISTSADGAGDGEYNDGVMNNYAYDGMNLTFTPSANSPNLLYYQCSLHLAMGYKINLINSPCRAGQYMPFGSSKGCMPCPAGTTSAAGATYCTPCAPGTFTLVNGSTTCTPCRAGTASPGGNVACSPCPMGKFALQGAASCSFCPPGKFSNMTGMSTCMTCKNGTKSCSGATTCTACTAGTFSISSAGAHSCNSCRPGTYAPMAGATQCMPCQAGTYSVAGASTCTKCPLNTTSMAGYTHTKAACMPTN